jgi:hypothetical protein
MANEGFPPAKRVRLGDRDWGEPRGPVDAEFVRARLSLHFEHFDSDVTRWVVEYAAKEEMTKEEEHTGIIVAELYKFGLAMRDRIRNHEL